MTTTKTYQYEFTIAGRGGEYWFIPMTPEQKLFWEGKGNNALSEHLSGGFEEDGTPPEFRLGYYDDVGHNAGGMELELNGQLIVRDEDGDRCFKRTFWDLQTDDRVVISRVADAPPTGAYFRTYEKSEWSYKLELSEPFNPSKLRLLATDTPDDELIWGASYAGEEVPMSMEADKEYQQHEALLY